LQDRCQESLFAREVRQQNGFTGNVNRFAVLLTTHLQSSTIYIATRLDYNVTDMSRDLFSALPAPLPLYILLELPDLKALYAAILASPHLLAVFRLDACLLFKTILRRTLPNDEAKPMLLYMRLCEAKTGIHTDESVREFETQDLRLDADGGSTLDAVLRDMPTVIVFRTIAQAVRIYDLAHIILRAKLDYLTTLRYARLADTGFRYDRDIPTSRQKPQGVPLEIPSRLKDPSWIEENRAVRALWLLAIRCQSSRAVDLEDKLSWINDDVAEIEASLRYGPTLLSLGPSGDTALTAHDIATILRPYRIPHPPYRKYTAASLIASPCFSRSPVLKFAFSETSRAWQQDSLYLYRENDMMRFLRASTHRPDSPLQTHDSSVFARLGFTFWDRWRVSEELELRKIPRCNGHEPSDSRRFLRGEPVGVGFSDEWFRLLKVYECEDEREKDGWVRG